MLPAPSLLPLVALPHPQETPTACSATGSWTCSAVFDLTGNAHLAGSSAWLIGKPLAIAVMIVVGVAARWVLSRMIDRLVHRAEHAVRPGAGRAPTHSRRAQRARSLGSLLKSLTTGLIFGIVFVMALSELGMNVAPILASAGVLGVAVGFGAQSLVKDLLMGVAMMIEDQYGVGDVVDLGEAEGTVEAVGLRVTRLRAIDGTVWYVRNGEIARVGNQSQNWARTVLDINVGYEEDLAHVRHVLQLVARGLWEDDAYRGVVIEEPEVWGVQSLEPDGVVVRVVLKTAPLEQWHVAREMRERVKARFDHEGITMPRPQRVLWHREGDADPADGTGPSGRPEPADAAARS